MKRKPTVTLDEEVYRGLYTVVRRRQISRSIERLLRPNVIGEDLDLAYREMARDEAREAEALQWSEATLGGISDESH
jgi:hypothetical protein